MTSVNPPIPAADDRRPLPPGTRVGDDFLVLRHRASGSVALSYEGLRLADQASVTLTEFFPAGLAARLDDGSVQPIRGWEGDVDARLQAFLARAERLRSLADPAIDAPRQELKAFGTVYLASSGTSGPALDVWANDLLRRPSAADLAIIGHRLVHGLAGLHRLGLAHGAVSAREVHLNEPSDVVLAGALLQAAGPEARAGDLAAAAGVLYRLVTGLAVPPPERDRQLDARFAAISVAAGDYPDALLEALDAVLEIGTGAIPVDPDLWTRDFLALTAGLAGVALVPPPRETAAAAKAAPAAPVPSGERRPSEPAVPPVDKPRSDPPKAAPASDRPRRAVMPMVVLTGLMLAGLAGWLSLQLLRQPPSAPTPAASAAAPRAAGEAPATPAERPAPVSPPRDGAQPQPAAVTAPPPVAETPASPAVAPVPRPEPPRETLEPAASPASPGLAVPPVPTPVPPPDRDQAGAPPSSGVEDRAPAIAFAPPVTSSALPTPAEILSREVETATSAQALVDLMARGADRNAAESRIAALGYVAIQAGATRIFRKPGDGEGFRDCDTCMDLVVVPAGRVTMQISIANASREIGIDLPRPFAVARHETTRGDFATFVRESGRVIAPGCHARSPSWRLDPALSWQSPGFDQGDDHPVVCVSFEDATAYAAWLSQKTGQRYRLPTDPEWHYLAAAERWLRRDSPQMCMIGNGADQSARAAFPDWEATGCTDGAVYTAPVGQFAAGLWGLHDLNGNVWEWVATCAPQPRADAEFPPRDCEAQAPRLLRGGSWADPPSLRMLDARIISAPAIRDQVAGFRLIREID
jgi:formylglycine-generating enzyme required for sulfatase activity